MRDFYYLDMLGNTLLDILEANFYKTYPITYNDNNTVLKLEMPGVKEKDLELTFSKDSLRLKLKQGDPKTIYIGEYVDEDGITANLEDGIR
jgi:HSP20 family molecular chaperone IbpA